MNRTPPPSALSERVRSLESTPMRAMADLGEARSGDVVNLAFGDPDFETPAHVIEAATAAAEDGRTHYTGNAGIPSLREAIAATYDEAGVSIDPEREVLVTTGAIQGLAFAMQALADPGEGVVVPTPAWPSYFTQAQVASADLRTVPLAPEDDFAIDGDRVADAIGADTAVVVLSSPSNPTGRIADPEAIDRVVDAAAAHGAWIVADEVYWRFAYDRSFETLASQTDYDRIVVANSASKTYAMTGWRIGWLVAPASFVEEAARLHQAYSTCASSISQHALRAALKGPREPVREMQTALANRREYVLDRVASIPGIEAANPQGGFYVFPDVRDLGDSSLAVARDLIEEVGVVTAPGVGFGDAGEGHLRISFAASRDDLETAFDGIERYARDVLS